MPSEAHLARTIQPTARFHFTNHASVHVVLCVTVIFRQSVDIDVATVLGCGLRARVLRRIPLRGVPHARPPSRTPLGSSTTWVASQDYEYMLHIGTTTYPPSRLGQNDHTQWKVAFPEELLCVTHYYDYIIVDILAKTTR